MGEASPAARPGAPPAAAVAALARPPAGLPARVRWLSLFGLGMLSALAVLTWLLRDAVGRNRRATARERALALERAALTAELTRRASFDPLTGLANRTLLRDRLAEVLARTAADGGTCALLLLDLDDFKTVNDSLGHLRGDTVLLAVAERLRARLRAGDTARGRAATSSRCCWNGSPASRRRWRWPSGS